VHVVGPAPGPGIDHTDVSSAVDAAAPGDVVLLLPAAYAGHVTVTKELVLIGVADVDGSPPLLAGLFAGGKASGDHVAARGIRLVSALPGGDPGGAALGPAGFDGVTYVEDSVAPAGEAGHDVSAGGADRLILVRCAFTGRNGSGNGQLGGGVPPTPALDAFFTKTALYECRFVGGRGANAFVGPFWSNPAQAGAAGSVFGAGTSTWTFASEVSVEGGTGGAGNVTGGGACLDPGDGGDGALLANPLWTLAGSFVGGPPGAPESGCPKALAGDDLLVEPGGSVTELMATPRRLSVPTPIEPGDTAVLRYEGAPGEDVWLLVGSEPKPLWVPAIEGVLALPLDHRVYTLGTTGPDGVLEMAVTIPAGLLPSPGGAEAIVMFLQALGRPSRGPTALSNPTLLAILDVP
jgi:hypothetical protein